MGCNGTLHFNGEDKETFIRNHQGIDGILITPSLEFQINNYFDQTENVRISCTFPNGARTEFTARIQAKNHALALEAQTSTTALGVLGSLVGLAFLVAVVIILIRRKRNQSKLTLVTVPSFEAQKMSRFETRRHSTLDEEEEDVVFCGITFPKSTIKDHGDFAIEMKLGEGQFGTVFLGYLDIGISR